MCGIAGIFDPHDCPDPERLRRLAAPMVCRGPDDEGLCCRGPLGLAHRRLAVIDLAGGHQPIFNEDESLAIVGNGEIYDFGDLRRDLEARGHRFRTGSDTEVALHLYEERGELCLDLLNGMFALAIADFARGELFLARDRFGQKPLFYAQAGGRFAFASGPAALATLPWVDTGIDPTAIHDYLEYQYIPQPRSIYYGIRKLPPGHWLRWRGFADSAKVGASETAVPTPYWAPHLLPGFAGTLPEAAGEVRRLLLAAVRRRLVADVPLGAFLSGGMDSSIVAALAQQCLREAGAGVLNTYSIGFPVASYDERVHAERVARHLGTAHHFLEVKAEQFECLGEVVAAFEEPFADASMVPTYLLSQFARRQLTVALSGDGADELFGGYHRYRLMHLSRWLAICPRTVRQAARRLLGRLLPAAPEERSLAGHLRRLLALFETDELPRYLALTSRFPAALRRHLYTDGMAAATAGQASDAFLAEHWPASGALADRLLELDCRTYLPEDILVKVDRASMAHALEVRSPFLDVQLAEFALSLPYSFKQARGVRKRLLRQAFADCLPADILARPKMGFALPVGQWLREGWRQPARELLLSGRLGDYFRPDRLEWLLDQHHRRQADYGQPLFALLVLALWLDPRG